MLRKALPINLQKALKELATVIIIVCPFFFTKSLKRKVDSLTLRSAWNGIFVSVFCSWWIPFPFSICGFSLYRRERRKKYSLHLLSASTSNQSLSSTYSPSLDIQKMVEDNMLPFPDGKLASPTLTSVWERESKNFVRKKKNFQTSGKILIRSGAKRILTEQSKPNQRDSRFSISIHSRSASWSFHWPYDDQRWWCFAADTNAKLQY